MVEQMVSSNLSKYGLGNCASIISSCDNHPVPLVAAKDTAARDVQNDTKYGPPRPVENSALHKEEIVNQPFQTKSSSGGNNVNRNLVYARRKSDAELSNSRTSEKNQTSGYQQAEQVGGDKKHILQMEANINANDGMARIRNCENEQPAMVNSSAMEHWNARFVQLQKYLKQCDTSDQEVYVQKLRSFSTDECSRRAVELERRAIQLMLDEGREIQRVKDLNVLGHSTGNHPLLLPVTPVIKSEKLV